MKNDKISYEEALSLVRSSRSIVQPNCGFVNQLKMWEEMNYSLEGNSKAHRIYYLQVASRLFRQNGIIPELVPDDLTNYKQSEDVYLCKTCLGLLFHDDHIIPHLKGVGKNGRNWCCSSIDCDTFYLLPLEWMGSLNKESGRLNCPQCSSSLGDWKWTESNCSCTSLVSPSFRIYKHTICQKKERSDAAS